MTKYREIIRLTGLGFSRRDIMASCGIAQKTVVKVQKRAKELSLTWSLDESMTDIELQKIMFSHESKVSANKRMPDFAYIRKELLRNGVSKKLLWTEYMEDCRANGEEPLMYLEIARTDGNYKKVMAKYANPLVLILDEWLLLKPTESEQRDIFELLHRRRKKSTTIFCSQYEFEEWYDQLRW